MKLFLIKIKRILNFGGTIMAVSKEIIYKQGKYTDRDVINILNEEQIKDLFKCN